MIENEKHTADPRCPGEEDLPPIACDDFEGGDLRDEVYRRTTRVLRRRVWTRRTVSALALLLVYAAGLGTGRLGRETAPVKVPDAVVEVSAPVSESTLDLGELLASADAVGRHVASLEPVERARFYEAAGDWYLNTAGDPARAAGCYRQVLVYEARLGINEEHADESWMLASLRLDQKENRSHVQ